MLNKKWRTRLSAMVTTTLLTSMVLPISTAWADTATPDAGNQVPVLSTVPKADATVVRPDTQIQLKLDPNSKHFDEWSKKYRQHDLSLALITDEGEGVFTKDNSNLTFDPTTGTLTFTPPANLTRYTTYGVVIGEHLPDWLKPKTQRDGKLPDAPKTLVQAAAVPNSLPDKTQLPKSFHEITSSLSLSSQGQEAQTQNVDVDPSTLHNPPQFSQTAPTVTSPLATSSDATSSDATSPVVTPPAGVTPVATPQTVVRMLGPSPVTAVNADLHPIDQKDGKNQKGIIESIQNSQITLFGGRQFTVDSTTHIHAPEQPQSTVSDLHTGDFVEVTLDDQSHVQNVNVTTKDDETSFVFTTGSDLHEPTHVSLQQQEQRPRVTDNGHFTLVSTDDYGLPAWGSQTSVNLITLDQSTLSSTAAVLPSASFTTSDQSGNTDVTVVDHVPQAVAAEVSMNGPYTDGHDAHGLLATFTFRPGLPANATLVAPDHMTVGTNDQIHGSVTDVYGNAVEDLSVLNLAASAGTVQTPVYTSQGQYTASYVAATKVQDVNLSLHSDQGTATAYGTIHLLPDVPATMTLNAPDKLQAGDSATLNGDVYDKYGNTVLDGSQLNFIASAGTIPSSTTTTNGHYQIDFTAPTKVQVVDIASASVKGTASIDSKVQIIPGPPAILSLGAKNTNLFTQNTTALSGQVADKYDNLISNQAVSLQAQHGTLSNAAPLSDENGWYSSTYTAPFYNGVDTVNATAGDAKASLNLNISSAGTGINPVTGQVEKVASIKFAQASYNATSNQAIKLSGHVYDANGQPLEDVVFSNASASAGTISGISYETDANGVFSLTYQTPASQATVTVTLTSNQISGTTTVNTMSYGYGYNPATGTWQAVGYLTIDKAQYTSFNPFAEMSPNTNTYYSVSLFPNSTIQFTGHAYSSTGQPLAQVQFNTLAATGGTVTGTSSNSTGTFTVNYQTPSYESYQTLQIGTGNVFATISANVSRTGQGYNPVTGMWVDVAHIIFNPSTYNVAGGNSVTVTGTVTDSTGQPLRMARVNIAVSGGSAASQVMTDVNGNFSLSYVAPTTEGTYTMTGYVNNPSYGYVSGTATFNVTPPPPPYINNEYLHIWDSSYLFPEDLNVFDSGQVMNGDGTPMSGWDAALQNEYLFVESGFRHFDYYQPFNNYGYFNGEYPAYPRTEWYSYNDLWGYTVYEWYYYDLALYVNFEHALFYYDYSITDQFAY